MIEEGIKPTEPRIASIQLEGEPYQRVVEVSFGREVVDCSLTLNRLSENTGYRQSLGAKIEAVKEYLSPLLEGEGYYSLDEKIKHGQDLTFTEAFSLITFVCSALNVPLKDELAGKIKNLTTEENTHLLQAMALLSAMSTKEGFVGLREEEIAGMVAATIHLDTVVRLNHPPGLVAFGGMGGDRGYPLNNGERLKLFSVSTLSAAALSVDTPVHKHHSYPNTSKIAGQSAIEAYGARSDLHSQEAFQRVLEETNLVMSSCHDTRTLHTLSHLLKGETINHVIGPLSFTVSADSPLYAMIGVNEKIHPEQIIGALRILNNLGFQRYENSAAYFGTDLTDVPEEMLSPSAYFKSRDLKSHVAIDEVAPPPYTTIASFLIAGENVGSFIIHPEDFYPPELLAGFQFEELRIPNTKTDILSANREALEGNNSAKTQYLAMTIGFGLFVRNYLNHPDALDHQSRRVNQRYLRDCTKRGLEILEMGLALERIKDYVLSTQKHSGGKT
jgi:anthranilate phosphoribosyltransferase